MKFILASSSPRRRQLLASIGAAFDVIASNVPEEHQRGEAPQDYVARLSRDKAQAVASQHRDRWVIAADTTVVLVGELLEKPADKADAVRMLAALAGKTHFVFTGVTIENDARNYRDTQVAETEVRILPLSSADIEWYVATGEPMDKAGAYAAQGIGAVFIDSIHGSYTNVVGLPLALLFQMLRKAGLDPLS
ncbi:MAG: Maf family protein [Thermoanaerobaculia bacterium]